VPKGLYNTKYEFNCAVCGNLFFSQREGSTYCSNLCRNVQWRKNNRLRDSITKERWILNNTERHLQNQRNYKNNRCQQDVDFKLKRRIRSRLGRIKFSNSLRTLDWLGCSIQELKHHLESKFLVGMSWDNYGKHGWHIDHIIPLSKFNLTDDEQLRKACHYTNLQPLWAKDNLVKSNKTEKYYE
jgi:hypothetical protein